MSRICHEPGHRGEQVGRRRSGGRGWLFQRYEEIELAVPYHQLEWRGRGSVRGLRSLPLRVTPRS